MICENCKNKVNEYAKICEHCGAILKADTFINNANVIVEQPVVNQVIAEEHKDKLIKKNKKQILTVTSIIFFALSIGTIILANFIENEPKQNTIVIPNQEINKEEIEETNTIIYKGYNVGYLSDYEATIEDGLLLLENKDLYFQLTLHPNVTKDTFKQNKDALRQILLNAGYIIDKEETSIRSGIEFYLIKLYNIIDNKKVDYEYFLTVENDVLYEILVLDETGTNYSKISNQLRTIVKETKIAN